MVINTGNNAEYKFSLKDMSLRRIAFANHPDLAKVIESDDLGGVSMLIFDVAKRAVYFTTPNTPIRFKLAIKEEYEAIKNSIVNYYNQISQAIGAGFVNDINIAAQRYGLNI